MSSSARLLRQEKQLNCRLKMQRLLTGKTNSQRALKKSLQKLKLKNRQVYAQHSDTWESIQELSADTRDSFDKRSKKEKVSFSDEPSNKTAGVCMQREEGEALFEQKVATRCDDHLKGAENGPNFKSNNNAWVGDGYLQPVVPAPRKTARVSITFSPKALPDHLPARESRETKVELKDRTQQASDTNDVSEREPLFLQDKGDKFFKRLQKCNKRIFRCYLKGCCYAVVSTFMSDLSSYILSYKVDVCYSGHFSLCTHFS